VIRNADWILDMGPEGGEDGGRVIAEGRPVQVAAVAESFTGQFLARYYAEHGIPAEAPAEELAPAAPKVEIAGAGSKRSATKKAAAKSTAKTGRPRKAAKA